MKVILIHPKLGYDSVSTFDQDSLFTKSLRRILRLGQTNYTPPLSLLMLGAVTPSDIEIKVVDERIEKINFDEEVDLVGITVTTPAVSRVKKISEEYKKHGVTVIVGGIHPSAAPEDFSCYADAVVIGEGEEVWPQILNDYKQHNLAQIYKGKPQIDLDRLPFPQRELLRQPETYLTTKVITTSRGCPNSCTFCACHLTTGRQYRVRSVENVLTELHEVPGKFILFLDDNLGWNPEYTKKLLRAITTLNIKWAGEISLSTLEDIELVDLIADSGCVSLLLGFESIHLQTIREIKKQRTNDPSRYRVLIQRLHDRHIPIRGQFIFGFDTNDKNVFRDTIDFISETCIEMPTINILIPYPGTYIFKKLEEEQRLLHKDWDYYDLAASRVVFRPKQMTPQELREGCLMIADEIFSLKSIIQRLWKAGTLISIGSIAIAHFNLQKRRNMILIKNIH